MQSYILTVLLTPGDSGVLQVDSIVKMLQNCYYPNKEPTESVKNPIKPRYLDQVTDNQPITHTSISGKW